MNLLIEKFIRRRRISFFKAHKKAGPLMAGAITENLKMRSVPLRRSSVQRDYMQVSVVFIPVEFGQR